MKTIQQLTEKYFADIVGFRRHLHQYPELSGREVATAEFVCAQLDKLGIPYRKNVGGYGVVATLRGNLSDSNRVVAIRADMDALPIQETTGAPYSSTVPNVMHACGHDVHTAVLLGCLCVFSEMRDRFGGVIKALFQPSEEEYPGGAQPMIAAGALEEPHVDVVFAQHVTPEIETGKIGLRAGAFMASTDEIHLTVRGRGGHAALPHEFVNPIFPASAMLQKLTEIIKAKQPTAVPTLLSFGKFVADGRANVIPEIAELAGTFRTFDEAWRAEAHQIIYDTATRTAAQFGATCDVNIKKGYPFLVNDPDLTARARRNAQDFLGAENVIGLPHRMTAEDFAYFAQQRPALLIRLGTKMATPTHLHNSAFDIDENALKIATGLMCWLTLCELRVMG